MPLVERKLISSPVFSGVRVALSLVFCVVFGRSLFVILSVVLSVLRILWYLKTLLTWSRVGICNEEKWHRFW